MNTGRNYNSKGRMTSVAFAAALASVVAALGGAGCGTAQPLNRHGDTAEIKEMLQAKLFRDARSRLEGIPVQPRALAWLRKARDHQRGGHAGEGAIQRRWFGEVAVNNLCMH